MDGAQESAFLTSALGRGSGVLIKNLCALMSLLSSPPLFPTSIQSVPSRPALFLEHLLHISHLPPDFSLSS